MSERQPGSSTNLLPIILVGLGLVVLIATAFIMRSNQDFIDLGIDLDTLPPIEIDQPAPELSLYDLNGQVVSLSDFHGDVVLLNNWATWCPPCREEMPEIQAFYQKYQEQGFQVVAIEAGDPENEVRDFVEKANLDFVILLDPENKSLNTFQQNTLPNSFVIDRNGQLRLAWIGAINFATLERYITPLIKE
jgi:peroxiredoxin